MNPLVPNAYELIVFYILPVLFVVALAVVILVVLRNRKSAPLEFLSEDENDPNEQQ
ncbi:hypothetical protein [Glutamicibacter sp.]|uniref:hypothetical protein n=1 Tax=Glutamicibacter sp. TaxID=1931995 RepID=UPI002FE3F31D